MRFHHLTDAVIVQDEVQTLPPLLWAPLREALSELVRMGTTKVLAMSATQPGFLPDATELIGDREAFFKRMHRYRLVLRHHVPMPMATFLDECRSRIGEWRGRKVLITLNTRRSARMVRDALAKENVEVEFLTADVTPADRLEAVERIKKAKQGIVVSTQCIEAGVDIDMDFVIRDFGPLDSLIQVAGRCNRNGRNERGVVEVVRLQDEDNNNRDFASYIYDAVLRDVTYRVLGNRTEVMEEDIYPLTQEYFSGLAENKDTGKEILKAWAGWGEVEKIQCLLRDKERPKISFVVVDRDATLRDDLEKLREIEDQWKRRRAFRRLVARIARLTVSVYLREGFDPSHYGDPFPNEVKEDAAWFWLLRAGYYTTERGLDLGRAAKENEGWGGTLIC